LAAVLLSFCAGSPADTLPEAVRTQVGAGKQLFITACANCHGSTGMGAIGPPLANRDLPIETIRETILKGRPGSPMPSFEDDFDANSQGAILAYVLWLTSGGRLPTGFVVGRPVGFPEASSTGRSSQPTAVGKDNGVPAIGAAIFFDATRLYSCRACHSYDKKGGPIGADLIGLHRTPLEVYRMITRPKVAASAYPAVLLVLRDGDRMRGIESDETDDTLNLFDVSSVPPVKRGVLKSEISEISAVKDSGIYDHTALPFSKQDLLDLSAFLGRPD
jgi:putative heme-binding domain-containing protein